MDVSISFIVKKGKHETSILTIVSDVYPSYRTGEKIFLQVTNKDDVSKSTKLTQFKIEDIHHSVHEYQISKFKNNTNPLGISLFLGMEIYVREIE